MPLSNFFRINMPYGIEKIGKNDWLKDNWFVFNRERMPLGWNSADRTLFQLYKANLPIYTAYMGLTQKKLLELAYHKERGVFRDPAGKINQILLYDDRVDRRSGGMWTSYFEKIKMLGLLNIEMPSMFKNGASFKLKVSEK